MPLVKEYTFAYDTWLNPVDIELADRKGEGPCPKEHGICTIWLTDIVRGSVALALFLSLLLYSLYPPA